MRKINHESRDPSAKAFEIRAHLLRRFTQVFLLIVLAGSCASARSQIIQRREARDFRSEQFRSLIFPSGGDLRTRAVLLGTVVREPENPDAVATRLTELFGIASLPPTHGVFHVIQRLTGPLAPNEIEAARSTERNPDPRPISHWLPPITRLMHTGECWILVYDFTTQKLNEELTGGTCRVDGLQDPLVAAYRRHTRWMVDTDRAAAIADARAAVLNENASLFSREAAMRGLALLALRETVGRKDAAGLGLCKVPWLSSCNVLPFQLN